MRNKRSSRDVPTMRRLLQATRYEVLPTPSIEDKVLESVPKQIGVTVTASGGKGLEATLSLAEKLAEHGYDTVPHLAARMISGRSELSEICDRLRGKGIHAVFVPAGDADPVGDYQGASDMLEDLTALGKPFDHVGITGYPESHPKISDDVTIQAMWDKRKHATHVVSNLVFDPVVVDHWVARMRKRGITLPLLLGLPGPIDRAKLMKMATMIGVGDSTKFLVKHKSALARLAAPGAAGRAGLIGRRVGPKAPRGSVSPRGSGSVGRAPRGRTGAQPSSQLFTQGWWRQP
jgi:methylenetetrahydrofolate reductase (NADPH)